MSDNQLNVLSIGIGSRGFCLPEENGNLLVVEANNLLWHQVLDVVPALQKNETRRPAGERRYLPGGDPGVLSLR